MNDLHSSRRTRRDASRRWVGFLIYAIVIGSILNFYLEWITGRTIWVSDLLVGICAIFVAAKVALSAKVTAFEGGLLALISVMALSAVLSPYGGIVSSIVGIFYLIKNFSWYAYIRRQSVDEGLDRSIYYSLVVIAWASAVIGLVQFIGVELPIWPPAYDERTVGLMFNANLQAMLLTLGSATCIYLNGKGGSRVVFFVVSQCVFAFSLLTTKSVSGIAMLLLLYIFVYRRKVWYMAVIVPALCTVILFSGIANNRIDNSVGKMQDLESYFRYLTFLNSFEVLKDYPLLGVGPGNYGGSVAHIFKSPVHAEYGTFAMWRNADAAPTTLDEFWGHLWGEVGIVGAAVYGLLLVMIIRSPQDKLGYSISLFFWVLLVLKGFTGQNLENQFPTIYIYYFLARLHEA